VREIVLSSLPHTWLIDLDGTIVEHNGHKKGIETLLDGALELWAQIPPGDTIVLLTARVDCDLQSVFNLLGQHNLRYDHVLCNLPAGERLLINDIKPRGLKTALAINVPRDLGPTHLRVKIDHTL